MKLRSIIFVIGGVVLCNNLFGQSTSPNPVLNPQPTVKSLVRQSGVITFSEYPTGTTITDQYENEGIVFTSVCFISPDGANPTSPVISGTPIFNGPISAKFVSPGTSIPTIVKSFTIDAGYFDNFGSTRIEWFDPDGKKLGQKINSTLGIETITVEGGNIASWTMSVVADEPSGFAIDNVSFEPAESSILFREKLDSKAEGTWGTYPADEIPGFDHTSLNKSNKVYESHPGYGEGTYLSSDGSETVDIIQINGIQDQFTRATFLFDSRTSTTDVVNTDEVPISEELAENMKAKIITRMGSAEFAGIDFSFPDGLVETLTPAVQKGRDNTFTCVGLVEWSAEQAGHNGGQGFIPNDKESFRISVGNLINYEVPLLSPQLLNWTMKNTNLAYDAKQWVQGFFDPVDFIVTDPLGRRLGYTGALGYINEIPNSFYPGNGTVEQFLVPNALPGKYIIRLIGLNANTFAAVGTRDASDAFNGMLTNGQIVEKTIVVSAKPGCQGDIDGDGIVNTADIDLLRTKLNRFTDGLSDPGDLDGDGLLSNNDLVLLQQLVQLLACDLSTIGVITNKSTVYYGYAPQSSAKLSVTGINSNELSQYQFLWSTGQTTQSINVQPTQSTTYSVKVTKGDCSIPLDIAVNVLDVRCAKNLQKVVVCHKGSSSLCIAANAVPAHLAHGDYLGGCKVSGRAASRGAPIKEEEILDEGMQIQAVQTGSGIRVMIISASAKQIEIRVYDSFGRIVEKSKSVVPNTAINLGNGYSKGIYIIEAIQGNERKAMKFYRD